MPLGVFNSLCTHNDEHIGVGIHCLFLLVGFTRASELRISKKRFHAFSIFIPTGCLEPTSHRFYNKYEEKITSYVCRSVFYSDDVH